MRSPWILIRGSGMVLWISCGRISYVDSMDVHSPPALVHWKKVAHNGSRLVIYKKVGSRIICLIILPKK